MYITHNNLYSLNYFSGEVEFDNIRFGEATDPLTPDPESYIFDLIVAVAPEEIIMDEVGGAEKNK